MLKKYLSVFLMAVLLIGGFTFNVKAEEPDPVDPGTGVIVDVTETDGVDVDALAEDEWTAVGSSALGTSLRCQPVSLGYITTTATYLWSSSLTTCYNLPRSGEIYAGFKNTSSKPQSIVVYLQEWNGTAWTTIKSKSVGNTSTTLNSVIFTGLNNSKQYRFIFSNITMTANVTTYFTT